MEKFRAFIAIRLTKSVQAYLNELVWEFSEIIPKHAVRWIKVDSIHLTLRFLGDTPTEILPSLCQELDAICQEFSSFSLNLKNLGCFPNRRRPRIIWIGIDSETAALAKLQMSIEDLVTSLGWKTENRQFHPHLTIGRVKDSRAIVQAGFDWSMPIEKKSFIVDSVNLYESRLLPSGAVYSVRNTSKLKL